MPTRVRNWIAGKKQKKMTKNSASITLASRLGLYRMYVEPLHAVAVVELHVLRRDHRAVRSAWWSAS